MTYATTNDILSFDPNSRYLTSTPDAPDFSIQIGFVEEKILLILRNAYPGMSVDDLSDTTQLKLIVIHGTLDLLYRSAVLAKGSGAQYAAEMHRKEFESLMNTKLSLINGETIKPKQTWCFRG